MRLSRRLLQPVIAGIAGAGLLVLPVNASDITLGELMGQGGKVVSVAVVQDWTHWLVQVPSGKTYICSLDYDSSVKYFDFRVPPPASIGSRCSEIL